MAAERRSEGGSVADFVEHAFPTSTVPLDPERPYQDYSYNFKGYPKWNTGDAWEPPEADRKTQFPMWPADMFAVTSALLERSAAYQRLANAIQPAGPRPDEETNWAKALIALTAPRDSKDPDPFGVRAQHRLFLRLAGALWSYGALFFSGVHKEVEASDGGIPNVELIPPEEIIDWNASLATKALGFLTHRANREIKESDVHAAAEAITKHVLRDLLNIFEVENRVKEFKASDRCVTSVSEHAVNAIIRIYNEEHKNDANPASLTESTAKRAQPYCLIIWATDFIQHHWVELRASPCPISLPGPQSWTEEDEKWWRAAIRLLILADEAGKGMGFSLPPKMVPPTDGKITSADPERAVCKIAGWQCRLVWDHFGKGRDEASGSKLGPISGGLLARTLTTCFNDELGSVLPKAHTPQNGCTIRSLSHNFALVPPKGRVRARWARQSGEDRAAYNILIIPYPYRIHASHFAPNAASPPDGEGDWGFFDVHPGWLYDEPAPEPATGSTDVAAKHEPFWRFFKSLLDQTDGMINAVMLPEAALDWETFDYVQSRIPEEYPFIELFVCGLTSYARNSADVPELGNYVATYMRTKESVDPTTEKPGWAILHVRHKHHRWKLDSWQLRRYALSGRLSPDRVWWESIQLPPREMLFAEFSPGSVVTSLICEDLARIEPCQAALRAVGPNLVLVLLMDSAQTIGRWPYQYAGVLTDDPGSSILTLTSLGLVNRANLSDGMDNREVAIWREPGTGFTRPISLPRNHHAQVVSIRREYGTERTLDGRDDNGDCAIVWRFAGLTPISTKIPAPGGGPDD